MTRKTKRNKSTVNVKTTDKKQKNSVCTDSSGTESVEFQRLIKEMRKKSINIIMDTERPLLIQNRDTFSFAFKLPIMDSIRNFKVIDTELKYTPTSLGIRRKIYDPRKI